MSTALAMEPLLACPPRATPPRSATSRPKTRRQPRVTLWIGLHGADREASATVARLQASPTKDAGPATPWTGGPHHLPPSPRMQIHEALPPRPPRGVQ